MTLPRTATIIGAGTMGPGMAATLARHGTDVRLADVDQAVLDRAQQMYGVAQKALDTLGGESGTAPGRVTYHLDLAEALDGTDFVIEAVPERVDLKRQVLAQVEAVVGDDIPVTSNTSGIPVSDLATQMQHPERLVGMHWSNPPHLVPMIEVVPGEQTGSAFSDRVTEVVEGIGYEAVREREVAGFVENRILYAILRECLSLVDAGIISRADLDTCVRWGIGYKLAVIGPMRLLDMAGLDIYQAVAGYLNGDLESRSDVSTVTSELAEQGRLGMKTGGGMYDYADGEVAAKRADIVAGLIAVRQALDASPRV